LIPQPIEIPATPEMICDLAVRWGIAPELAKRLFAMRADLPFGLSIRSGYRTAAEQEELRKARRQTAPDDLSTHLSCPATGADLDVHVPVTLLVKQIFGDAARNAGLRWGGGSKLDLYDIPSDWNHVDLGPRER
jgi:hypothetical protein